VPSQISLGHRTDSAQSTTFSQARRRLLDRLASLVKVLARRHPGGRQYQHDVGSIVLRGNRPDSSGCGLVLWTKVSRYTVALLDAIAFLTREKVFAACYTAIVNNFPEIFIGCEL